MRALKRKILFTLTLPVDFFKISEGFLYRPYHFIYHFLPSFQRGSIRDAIGQLVKSQDVDKIVRNHVPNFRLTGMGRERLLSFFPISFGQSRVWDRRWRLAIIKEKLRGRRLRRKLRGWGFKKLARGVYLTPMPVSEKLKNYLLEEKLLGKVTVVESRRLLGGDDKNLAKNIWQLEELVGKYHDFINQCQKLLKRTMEKKRLVNREKIEVVKLLDDYFFLLSDDPGLPKKVLPVDWPADFAREIFLKIFQQLEKEKRLIQFDIL